MAHFKLLQKTWVLLVDVDEYITFNNIEEEDDPDVPLDYAPEGIPTLSNWERKEYNLQDGNGRLFSEGKFMLGEECSILCHIRYSLFVLNIHSLC